MLWIVIGLLFFHGQVAEWVEDIAYVGVTSVIVYLLTARSHKAIRANETALRESEDRLARILETNASGIMVCNEEGIITFANHAAERILGMERGSIVGMRNDDPSWDRTDASGAPFPRGQSPIDRVKATRMPVNDCQVGLRRRDGERIFITSNAAPLLNASGDMVGIVASFADITETKKAEELKLRKLLLAVEQSPSAIVITSPDGTVEYVNPRHAFMTGYSAQEILGRPLSCPEGVLPGKKEEIFASVRAGNTWRGEFWCRRKNGEPYCESTSVSPIRTAEGGDSGMLWVREDITVRKEADEALLRSEAGLREAQEKFRNLVETVSDWVWEIDGNWAYTYVSPRVRDLLGYEPEEIIGKTPFDLMPAFEARRLAEVFGQILARREPFHGMENINRHRDGRYVVLETSGTPFFGPDGEFLGYRGVDRDVGERKRAEEMLRSSEELFRQLFEQNEEPLFLFRSGSSGIVDVNPAAERLYGFPREELLRKGVSLFVPKEEVQGFAEAVASIRPGSGLSLPRLDHFRRDGDRVIVSIRGKSVQLASGHVAYCSIRDITARVQMEEEAKHQQAQLIQANRMASLGTIVSGVAHEVNNPNNLIMFNAPMILSAWKDAKPVLDAHFRENGDFPLGGLPYSEMREVVHRLAEGISGASARIKGIVANLKDFTRQDKSRGHVPVDVNDVVRTAVAILNHEIIKATHRFEAFYAEGLPPVAGSAQELEQVVINLLNNALQALPSNQAGLKVTTGRNPGTGEVEVVVADEGMGMSPEVLARIAEPFFSTRLDSGGLGLGLSISRSILKEHGGSLSFESEVGKGTRAIVRLPAIGAGAEAGPAKAGPIAFLGG
ncbi:MAG TPA: PAS domain S-box protein [Candidatus Deferrimicrobiaceae bacterium]